MHMTVVVLVLCALYGLLSIVIPSLPCRVLGISALVLLVKKEKYRVYIL